MIGWVWQFTLQSAQRHNQISKIGDIFEKISTVSAVFSIFSIVWCSKCTIPNSLLKPDPHGFLRAGCSVRANFFVKSCECRRWLTLGRSKWIFLPTSPSQRGKNELLSSISDKYICTPCYMQHLRVFPETCVAFILIVKSSIISHIVGLSFLIFRK